MYFGDNLSERRKQEKKLLLRFIRRKQSESQDKFKTLTISLNPEEILTGI